MGRFWRVLGVVCVLFIAASEPAAAKYENIRRIGVISAIGDTFAVEKVGLTVFGNERKEIATESWKIDDFVIARIRASLAGRFDVRTVNYNRAALLAPNASIFASTASKIADVVRQASPQGLDAYLVVTKGTSAYGTSNQSVTGLGIIDGSGLIGTNISVFALYWITLIDGRQFTGLGAAPGPQAGFLVAIHGPSRQVDKSWWPTVFDAGANAKLKGVVVELLGQNLPATLQKLELLK